MSEVFSVVLSSDEVQMLSSKICDKFHENEKQCHIWTGDIFEDGYPCVRVSFRGKRLRVRVHRLVYYLANPNVFLDSKIHTIHLCHNKLCINIEHLSYEPSVVNCQRNTCVSENNCFGHAGYKNCIL